MHQDSCDLPPPQPSPASGGGSTLSLPLALRRRAQCASLIAPYAASIFAAGTSTDGAGAGRRR
jgi:hypothetical protein